MRYCRFETDFGPRYGEVRERAGNDWIERLLPPPVEDPGRLRPAPKNLPALNHSRLGVSPCSPQ